MYAVISILCKTAKIHQERDLKNVTVERLMEIINLNAKNSDVYKNMEINYMQIEYGKNNMSGNGDIVIVYRYFAKNDFWSATVGFDPKLLPDLPQLPPLASVTTADEANMPLKEYSDLAAIFAGKIRYFLTNVKAPSATSITMIDDKPSASDQPLISKIGYLIEIARNNPYKENSLNATWSNSIAAIPINKSTGEKFPGYGPPDATAMYLTTVTPIVTPI